MPKINQEEYEVLKDLDDKWKWIARDKDGTLVMGAGKNERYLDGWFPPENIGDSLVADEINAVKVISEWGNLFQFIKWEDEDPYNIQELIEEYLYDNQPKLFIDGQEQSFEFIEESEETEVKKDLEWLKEETSAVLREVFNNHALDYVKYIEVKRQLERLFAQLDEPEVLTQEFIDKYKVDYDNWMPAVPIVHLQNLLVPKQELPVIPQLVADWIEEMKQEERPLYSVMSNLMNKTNHKWSVWKNANKNFSEIIAQAWLYGYEVAEEREQKYRVIFPSVDKNGKGFNYLAKDCYHKELWVEDARTDGLDWEERSLFTEDEIRDLDKGDILFEHFAVKVEELEE